MWSTAVASTTRRWERLARERGVFFLRCDTRLTRSAAALGSSLVVGPVHSVFAQPDSSELTTTLDATAAELEAMVKPAPVRTDWFDNTGVRFRVQEVLACTSTPRLLALTSDLLIVVEDQRVSWVRVGLPVAQALHQHTTPHPVHAAAVLPQTGHLVVLCSPPNGGDLAAFHAHLPSSTALAPVPVADAAPSGSILESVALAGFVFHAVSPTEVACSRRPERSAESAGGEPPLPISATASWAANDGAIELRHGPRHFVLPHRVAPVAGAVVAAGACVAACDCRGRVLLWTLEQNRHVVGPAPLLLPADDDK